MSEEKSQETITIMVTGGSGLVGKGIETIVNGEEKRDNENWVFLRSSDGDLRNREETFALFEQHKFLFFVRNSKGNLTFMIVFLLRPNYVIHLAAMVGGLFRNLKFL